MTLISLRLFITRGVGGFCFSQAIVCYAYKAYCLLPLLSYMDDVNYKHLPEKLVASRCHYTLINNACDWDPLLSTPNKQVLVCQASRWNATSLKRQPDIPSSRISTGLALNYAAISAI